MEAMRRITHVMTTLVAVLGATREVCPLATGQKLKVRQEIASPILMIE
jgi:hypothetical protein